MLLCETCFNDLPNLCVKCGDYTDTLLEGKYCPSCYYSQGWSKQKRAHCLTCTVLADVNEFSTCRNCYIKGSIRLDSNTDLKQCPYCRTFISKKSSACLVCSDKVRACVTCRDTFMPQFSDEWECHKCKPNCLHCGKKYITLSYKDTLCPTCDIIARENTCLSCKENKRERLNMYGHCPDCAVVLRDPVSTYKYHCIRCKTRRVNIPRGVCTTCQTKLYACPNCFNSVGAFDMICKTCEAKSKRKPSLPLRVTTS